MTATTFIHSITERHLLTMTTTAAILTAVGWIDFDKLSASFCRFARELTKESTPRRVGNTLGEARLVHHSIDIQILNTDDAKSIDNLSRLLVNKIATLEIDSFMKARHHFASLRSLKRSNLLFRQFALGFCHSLFFLAKKALVFNAFIIRQMSKRFESDIKSDRFRRFKQRFCLYFTREGSVPLAGYTAPDGQSLDVAFNRAMHFDMNIADFRQLQMMSVKREPGLRIGEAIVSEMGFEGREASLAVVLFDSAKEGFESKVNAHRDILQDLRVNLLQRWALFFVMRSLGVLVIEGQGLFVFFILAFSIFKQFVVQPVTFSKRLVQEFLLSFGWKKSHFESFTHKPMIAQIGLMPNIIASLCLGRNESDAKFIPIDESGGFLSREW
jgi:hypothetical protein